MKNFKKLSVAIVALAMCALLGISVWAANTDDVTFTATFGQSTLCVSDAAQTATLTVRVSSEVEMDSLTASVKSDLTVTNITFGELTGAEWNKTDDEIMIAWYEEEAENVTTDILAVITVEVPANAKGTYEIGFQIIDISSDYGIVWETDETVTATLTVADHDWNAPTYEDTDGETHTAVYTCKNNHTKTETAPHDFTTGTCVCGAVEPAPAGLKGDVNLDGKVDALDLDIMVQVVPGIAELTSAQALINADVNEDSKIDAVDLDKFVRFVPGIITDWNQD